MILCTMVLLNSTSHYRTEEQSKIIDEKYYYRQETLSQITNSIQKSNGRTFEDIAKEHDVSASGQSRDVDISISPYWN
jgi:hypothetical protein